jgi:hypothetical protein
VLVGRETMEATNGKPQRVTDTVFKDIFSTKSYFSRFNKFLLWN